MEGRSGKRPRGRVRLLMALVLAVLSSGGCASEEQGNGGADSGVTRTASEGPVTLAVSASADEIGLEDRVEVFVALTAPAGTVVEFGDYARRLTETERQFEYRIADSKEESAVPTGDEKLRWTRGYTLEFFLPGDFELPGPMVRFRGPGDEDEAPGDEWTELTTEPLMVVVRDDGAAELSEAELRELTRLDPVDLPTAWGRWWWLAAAIAVALAVAAILVARWIRKQREVVEPPLPADVWAHRQIAALVGEDLLGRGQVQEFYYRLSDVVRGYIERRFGLSAPEMTTEEFLAAASRDARLAGTHTAQLDGFLYACDLVKYARAQPALNETDEMLKAAKRFIEDTRDRVEAGSGQRERAA